MFIAKRYENSGYIAICHTPKPGEACAISNDEENLFQSE
jgi:hypothetical protein